MTPDRSTDTGTSQSTETQADRSVDADPSADVDTKLDVEESPGVDIDADREASQSLAERLAAWIVPERNPAGAVYGLITLGALLAAESGLRETYPETIGSATLAVVLYWFAHSYSDVLGLRLTEYESFSWAELWQTFSRDWAIAKGASVPLLVLLVAWTMGASQTTGVTAAVWSIVASLIAFELAAGVRSKARPLELALEVLVGASMGIGILALRALLH
ncbi:MAG TPA: hypothetical protein VGP18_11000 [Solirubrobacteraceae bacterium]|nr:hypothetical protein [Solirubrobacteraceae bacterium]